EIATTVAKPRGRTVRFPFVGAPPSRCVLPSFPTRRSSDLADAGREYGKEGDDGDPDHQRRGRDRGATGFTLGVLACQAPRQATQDRKSTRLHSSHVKISYAAFCLKKNRP